MCYPKPGPRCSHHVSAAKDNACQVYQTAVQQLDAVRTGTDQSVDLATAENNVSAAVQLYAKNLADWHATPAGMRELEDKIVQLSKRPNHVEAVTALEGDLQQGKLTRRKQIAAYAATVNPTKGLSNIQLKTELNDLIVNRMPAMADDVDGLAVEQARFDAVLKEISNRKKSSQRQTQTNLISGNPKSVVVKPDLTTKKQTAWNLTEHQIVIMADQNQLHVKKTRRLPETVHTTKSVEVEFYNPASGESVIHLYRDDTVFNVMDYSSRR